MEQPPKIRHQAPLPKVSHFWSLSVLLNHRLLKIWIVDSRTLLCHKPFIILLLMYYCWIGSRTWEFYWSHWHSSNISSFWIFDFSDDLQITYNSEYHMMSNGGFDFFLSKQTRVENELDEWFVITEKFLSFVIIRTRICNCTKKQSVDEDLRLEILHNCWTPPVPTGTLAKSATLFSNFSLLSSKYQK